MKLVFATHNNNKLKEVQAMVPVGVTLLSLNDIGCMQDIPETATTLEGNARIKADFVTKKYGLPCFADDTGLLVDALNGEPGVYSARYAGNEKDSNANMDKVLKQLKGISNRSASFKTVIALNLDSTTKIFEGSVKGSITDIKKGDKGFGYDPIFKPYDHEETFAQLPLSTKNKISHRGMALVKLINYLNSLYVTE